MTTDQITTADRIAMLLGGGLVLLGTAVLGLVNTLAGAPTMPVVEEEMIVAEPLVSPDLRASLIALGLLVWLVVAIYKVTQAPSVEVTEAPETATAD